VIDYILKCSKRKTTTIRVKDGKVIVSAPLDMPLEKIEDFIKVKEKWILSKLTVSLDLVTQRQNHALSYSSMLLYRGKLYPISVGTPFMESDKNDKQIGFVGTHFFLPPNLTPDKIKSNCIILYKMLAKHDLTQKTALYARQMSLTYKCVKINSSKTRWGSCSGKKSINYSWRLIMADDDLIDYVVVHELAHTAVLNHSPAFWKLVENVFPDYLDRRRRLRELERKLRGEEWE